MSFYGGFSAFVDALRRLWPSLNFKYYGPTEPNECESLIVRSTDKALCDIGIDEIADDYGVTQNSDMGRDEVEYVLR